MLPSKNLVSFETDCKYTHLFYIYKFYFKNRQHSTQSISATYNTSLLQSAAGHITLLVDFQHLKCHLKSTSLKIQYISLPLQRKASYLQINDNGDVLVLTASDIGR